MPSQGVHTSETSPTLPPSRKRVRGPNQASVPTLNRSAPTLPSSSQREGSSTGRGILSASHRHVLDDVFDDSSESLPDDAMDLTNEPDHDEMRLSRPQKRQKRINHPSNDQYERDFKPKIQKLNRLIRWSYFMEFSTQGMHEVILAAFHEVSVDSYEYSYARQKILNWTKAWKSKTLQNMLECVREEKEQARRIVGINIINVNNVRDLTGYFRQKFIPEKFYQVFYWMKNLLSVEESSDLGQFYIKNIFANLAAQVKLYDDICDKNDNGAMVTTWDHIRVFWNEMSSVRQYKHVDRGVFKEKYRRQLKSKKRNQPAQQIAEVLCFDEEAPPKTSANTTRY